MSTESAVRIFKSLENEDFRALMGVELGMFRHAYVPFKEIVILSELPQARVPFHLEKLERLKLIQRWAGPYTGYVLNTAGYDCLAIHAMVKAGILEAFGNALGVGKEADVYDALTPKGERVAVKFHRLGRISFRQTRRMRGYAGERRHISWLYQSRLAAGKEFQALKILYPAGVSVPNPIAHNRHMIVMGLIEGTQLANFFELPNPDAMLREILHNIRTAYVKAGIIHADLSEFNVIVKPDGHGLIIDWPQYVTKDHPNARSLLRRDIVNLYTYFKRKHKVKIKLPKALKYAEGKISKI